MPPKPVSNCPSPRRRRTMLGGSADCRRGAQLMRKRTRCTALQSRASLMVCAYSCGGYDDTARLNSAARGSGSHDPPLVCALLGQSVLLTAGTILDALTSGAPPPYVLAAEARDACWLGAQTNKGVWCRTYMNEEKMICASSAATPLSCAP